ncbi:hypothetical protein AOQ84DRAFT_278891 [Glonium stellatum]|uniref:Uncharacterized protein n=1 Tax=Glonium stellatum TaxID=574774 RepID=A0A8E2FE07_9PEZI|nr:hypothetical protein AOQ84DRAFT_278891 [Glonium stellatum]
MLVPLLSQCQAQPQFNLTAISFHDNSSRLECWAMAALPKLGAGAVNFPIGDFTGGSIGIIPPHTYSSSTIRHAPAVQYSLVLSGLVHIRIPNSTLSPEQSEAWIVGGKYGILIAADTVDVSKAGHVTEFPSSDDTVIAQFPIPGNKVPEHRLLYTGPCKMEELVGL